MNTRNSSLRRFRGLSAGLAFSATVGLGLGCSLTLGFEVCETNADCVDGSTQKVCSNGECVDQSGCSSDSECSDLFGSGFVCESDVCVDGSGASTTGDDTSGTATTGDGTGDTGDTAGTGDTGDTTGATACTTNTECREANSDDFFCNPSGECQSLLSAECTKVRYPSGEIDNVVWIGSIFATQPPFDILVQPLENAVQLAITDFNGITSLQGGAKIGWVACDETAGTTAAQAAATHLSDVVGVQAIVGPTFSQAVIDVAENVTVDAGVFTVTPTATNKDIATIDDNDLQWRTIANDNIQANAMAQRIAELSPAPTRVVVLYKGDKFGRDLSQDVFSKISASLPMGTAIVSEEYPDPVSLPMDELTAAYGQVLATAVGAVYGADPGNPNTDPALVVVLDLAQSVDQA